METRPDHAPRPGATRADGRALEERARELSTVQALVQGAAEARTVDRLLSVTAEVLQRFRDVEVVGFVHRIEQRPAAEVFRARPTDPALVRDVVHSAARFLGWNEDIPDPAVTVRDGEGFDRLAPPLRTVLEQRASYLPIRRRERTIAAMVVIHPEEPGDAEQRLLYSAANQLSLQLDRILTVREAEADRFRSVLDSMSSAVVLTDTGLRVRLANRAAEELLARLRVSAAGGSLASVEARALEMLAARLGTDRDAVESDLRLEDGGTLHVTVSSYHGGAGAAADGLVFVLADVTDARRLQEQLVQAEKLSALGEMISGVAHELNNPLASVVGYAQLVRASVRDDERLTARLETLDREAQRCQRVVRNLLSFARRHEPENRLLSLNEIVESVVALLRYQMRVDGIEVRPELDRSLPAMSGDGHLLQQAVLNLLTNAQQAIRGGGDGGTIRVRTVIAADDRIGLVVEDDGPGIPEDVRARVFDPFFTTKPKGEGTGLGLSLVHGTVTRHGGTIRASRAETGGARFDIEFPAALPGRATGARTPAPEDGVAPASGSVLVVDDEAAVAALIREALEADGFAVTVVADGREALDALDRARFDVVLLDWHMPTLGGERLYAEIRDRHPGVVPNLVLTTGDTISREPDAVAKRRDIPLLHKPFDLVDLRRIVRDRLAT